MKVSFWHQFQIVYVNYLLEAEMSLSKFVTKVRQNHLEYLYFTVVFVRLLLLLVFKDV